MLRRRLLIRQHNKGTSGFTNPIIVNLPKVQDGERLITTPVYYPDAGKYYTINGDKSGHISTSSYLDSGYTNTSLTFPWPWNGDYAETYDYIYCGGVNDTLFINKSWEKGDENYSVRYINYDSDNHTNSILTSNLLGKGRSYNTLLLNGGKINDFVAFVTTRHNWDNDYWFTYGNTNDWRNVKESDDFGHSSSDRYASGASTYPLIEPEEDRITIAGYDYNMYSGSGTRTVYGNLIIWSISTDGTLTKSYIQKLNGKRLYRWCRCNSLFKINDTYYLYYMEESDGIWQFAKSDNLFSDDWVKCSDENLPTGIEVYKFKQLGNHVVGVDIKETETTIYSTDNLVDWNTVTIENDGYTYTNYRNFSSISGVPNWQEDDEYYYYLVSNGQDLSGYPIYREIGPYDSRLIKFRK